jgi:hypothetical protein
VIERVLGIFDDVGTPSVECCVSEIVSPQGWLEGLYQTLGELDGIVFSSLFFKQSCKWNKCLVSPTPLCGCQAQGFT